MSRHGHGAAPSQRQLRVAEQMRHVLAEALMRGELHDPGLAGRSLTVGEVRVSRDLRPATVFASRARPAAERGGPGRPQARRGASWPAAWPGR